VLRWSLPCDGPRHANRWWLDGALAWPDQTFHASSDFRLWRHFCDMLTASEYVRLSGIDQKSSAARETALMTPNGHWVAASRVVAKC
jgi:hypothetical protein